MSNRSLAIISNAVIWGLVIVGVAIRLKGTGCFGQVQLILAAGAGFSNLAVAAILGRKPGGKAI